jgi:hypothetical protein
LALDTVPIQTPRVAQKAIDARWGSSSLIHVREVGRYLWAGFEAGVVHHWASSALVAGLAG